MDEHKKELLKSLPKIDEMMLLLEKRESIAGMPRELVKEACRSSWKRSATGSWIRGEGGVPVRRGSAPRPDLGRSRERAGSCACRRRKHRRSRRSRSSTASAGIVSGG